MAFEYTIEAERELVTITARGPATFRDGVETMRQLAADPGYRRGFAVLVDARENEYSPSLEETRVFVDIMDELDIFRGRMALVVSTGLHFGIGRQLSAIGGTRGRRIDVFTGIRNALLWLERAVEQR